MGQLASGPGGRTETRPPWAGYGVALAAVAAALAVRWLLDPILGDHLPLVTLFGAVAAAVWLGGYRPAVLAAVVGYLACDYLFIPPRGAFGFHQTATVVGFLAYLLTCAVIIGFGEALRAARRRAAEQGERLRTTLASIGDAVITTDREGRVTNLNAVAEALTGWSNADAAGRPLGEVFRIVNEETRAVLEDPAARALRDGVVVGLANHTVLIAKDGTERPIDDSAAPIRCKDNEVVGCVLVFRDVTKRRRAEEQLRHRTATLRAISDTTTDLIFLKDRDCRLTFANPATLAAMGLTEEQAIGVDPRQLFADPAEGERIWATDRRIMATGETESVEEVYTGPQGSRTFLSTKTPLRDERGAVVGVIGISRDVTDRRRDEEQLRASEERYRGIFAQTLAGIAETDLTGRFVQVNRRYCEIVGRAADELYGLRMQDITHPDDLARNQPLFERAVVDGTPFTIEKRYVRPDGTAVWVSNSVSLVRDAQGRPTHVVAASIDITERKRADDWVAANQKTVFDLVERCPFGIYIVDADFRIAHINAGSRAGAFANVRPAIGRPFDEAMRVLWPEPVAADVIARFRHTLETGEPYYSKDFVRPRADIDQTEGYEWELHRINLPDGRHGVVCYYYDSTKLRQVERALRESDQRKDEFLATLAHELRNPLAPIRNGLQVMKLAGDNPAAAGPAREMMERQVAQMVRLIDDLMDLSRVSRGKVELRLDRVVLADVVRQAVETSRPLIEANGHELTLDVPAEPIAVDADATRLAQVFANLLNNAAKYTEPGGRLRLSVERRGGEAVVTVTDNGVGIPPEMLPQVFEMFAQVDRSLERAQGGLGIGLSLVKQLVELHGGSVAALSAGHGQGSEFVVQVPVADDAPPAGAAEQDRGRAPPAARRILIADDNRDSAESLATSLRLAGHNVRVAYDGVDAVTAAEKDPPDVAFLDLGMPRLSGYDAARRIRDRPWGSRIVLVALTGWGQDQDRRLSTDAGFDHHLVKPVDPAVLERMLAGLKGVNERRV